MCIDAAHGAVRCFHPARDRQCENTELDHKNAMEMLTIQSINVIQVIILTETNLGTRSPDNNFI